MAKAQMLFPDDLTERLSKLGEKTGEIAEKVLEAGGKVALEIVRDQLDQAIPFHRRTEKGSRFVACRCRSQGCI